MIVIPSEARNLQSAREDKTQIPRFTRDDKLLRVSGTASPLTNRAKTSLYLPRCRPGERSGKDRKSKTEAGHV